MRRLPILCLAALLSACYDSSFGEPEDAAGAEAVTTTLRYLREVYAGETFLVTGDVVVAGRVTTSDAGGNFYRTLCIEDDGAALEIMAGLDQLHNDYPAGCRVVLRLQGLALGESRGVLQVGRMPQAGSGFVTDYIGGTKAAIDEAFVRDGEKLQTPRPALWALAELTPELCGTLVRIEGLHYAPEGLSPATWSGYKRFTDRDGAEIYTYVRAYADFADAEVPAGERSLTGILQYDPAGEGRYIIKLRDENDCAL